jgi:adenylosuccinate synthase
MTNFVADFVIGLQYGDEGKGKVAASLAAQCDYDTVVRYNGGPNAGHSVVLDEATVALHQIPTGALFKKHSYIGPGSVVSLKKLEEEVQEFETAMGFNPYPYLNISPKAILINETHISHDKANQALSQGSTSSGIAPAYSSFYQRTAQLAGELSWPYIDTTKKLSPFEVISSIEVISEPELTGTVLFEGAQGHYLNPYQGSYPYTTSSSSHPGSAAMTFGFPAKNIRNVIGVAKCYETRSGIDPDFYKVMKNDGTLLDTEYSSQDTDAFNLLSTQGKEIGVTTGRKRQVRWLDATRLIKAINETGANTLVIQKWDILAESSIYKYYYDGVETIFYSLEFMQKALIQLLIYNCPDLKHVQLGKSPHWADLTWSMLDD